MYIFAASKQLTDCPPRADCTKLSDQLNDATFMSQDWYGFNPGTPLSALDIQGISRVSFNTTMAACSAGLTALFYGYMRVKKWDLGLTTNGFLAGLVGITCPCYWVSPTGAFFIGAVAGIVVIWATLSLGLFATGQYGLPTPTGMDASVAVKGLFYGGGATQLMAQAIGSGAVVVATLTVSFALMYAVKATETLRVSREGEIEGWISTSTGWWRIPNTSSTGTIQRHT